MSLRRTAETGPARTWVLRGLALTLGLGAFLGGLAAVGRLTREGIRGSQRFTLAVADIDCPSPPGQARTDFLAEVAYGAGLPERMDLLADGLAGRLAEAFGRHPWVEAVERVAILPGQQIEVRLSYRNPMLAVLLTGPPPDGRQVLIPVRSSHLGAKNGTAPARVVDHRGVLLPATARSDRLPVLYHRVPPPAGPAGTPWGDPAVEAAAETAALLQAHQDRLRLEDFELGDGGLVLSTPGGSTVLWGRPPGREQSGEAAATEKLRRLTDYCAAHGSLDSPAGRYEHDVRPRDRATQRPRGGA
jgi:hypothetical protein